jgi:hypothetical protein
MSIRIVRHAAAQSLPASVDDPIVKAQGRQILFYAPAGLLGGTFTCSRRGATGRRPDLISIVRATAATGCAARWPVDPVFSPLSGGVKKGVAAATPFSAVGYCASVPVK